MKTNKMITIDEEINQKLRMESNASALINRLLQEHYEFTAGKKKDLTQQKEVLLKNYSKKAKEVRNEVKILRKVESLGCDFRTIRWLRGHSEVPSIFEAGRYRRNRQTSTTAQKMLQAWEFINKHGNLFEKV